MQTHRQQQNTGQSHLHAAKQTQSGVKGLNGVGLNKNLSSPVPFIFPYKPARGKQNQNHSETLKGDEK